MASAMLGLIILSAGTLALLISLAIVSGYMNGRFVIGSALHDRVIRHQTDHSGILVINVQLVSERSAP